MKPLIEGPKPPTGDKSFHNSKYQVILRFRGELTELALRRVDRRPVTDWRDVQWIKNQLLGPDVEAVQLFPAESRLVDTSNQFYLYAFPAGFRFPFGFGERLVTESVSVRLPGNHQSSVQRPFADHVRPPDLEECEARAREEVEGLMGHYRSNGLV